MRIRLTPAFVESAAVEAGKERSIYWDSELRGFGLVATSGGAKSFCVQYRAGKKSRRMIVPLVLGLAKARKRAKELLGQVAMGQDPLAEKRRQEQAAENSLRSVTEAYFAREGKKYRTERVVRAVLERLVLPKLGAKQIDEIKRSDIVNLLDGIEDKSGPFAADKALSVLGRVINWHAKRNDDFQSPIIRGMARTNKDMRERARILSDDELRSVWKATERRNDPFSHLIRFLLLTATRKLEAGRMTWSELTGADWTIPAARYKSNRDTLIPLSAKARTLLESIPKIGPGDWVFTIGGLRPLNSYASHKNTFDRDCGVTGWRLHDLRRTARSLMSRAGVDANIAERCLGHKIGGVRGIYDRYEFRDEKKRAFEALAAQIERIVDPQPNIVALQG